MKSEEDDFRWGIEAKVEVRNEIGAVQEQRPRAQAAGDLDEDRRLRPLALKALDQLETTGLHAFQEVSQAPAAALR